MNCEKCAEECRCPKEPPPQTLSGSETAGQTLAGSIAASDDAWRGELAARLNRYRSRRKAPPPRYPSLKLPFEIRDFSARIPAVESSLKIIEPASSHALALDSVREHPSPIVEAVHPQHAETHQPVPPTHTAKVIEFPRFAWAPPSPPPDQLAEPVMDRPRILDVPEVAPAGPALGGITIERAQVDEVERQPGIDCPLQSAPLGRRVAASVIDGILIATASLLFGLIFWKIASVRPPELQFIGVSAGILAMFWAAYQYLLIVYSASTPGLRAARLTLTRFDGAPTSRSSRRWRVLASYLSAASLGMGYIWVFLDEDALCWHDRISHTYLAPNRRSVQANGR